MKKSLTLCILGVIFASCFCRAGADDNNEKCDDDWRQFAEFCYKAITIPAPFDSGKVACHEQDAQPASFHSKEEFNFLVGFVSSHATLNSSIWIGMKHIQALNPKANNGKNKFLLRNVDNTDPFDFNISDYGHYWGRDFLGTGTSDKDWEPYSPRDECIEMYTANAIRPQHYRKKLAAQCCEANLPMLCRKPVQTAVSTSPKPGDHSTSPKPGDHSTSPKPGDKSTSPKPGDHSTSPKPGDHSTSPKPGDHSTSPKPGDHSTSPKPGDHSTSPKPGDHSTSPKPDDHSTSPKPGDHSTSPKPGDKSTTPNLGDHSTSPKPDDHSTSPKPGDHSTSPKPGDKSTTPNLGDHSTSPKPGDHSTSPKPDDHSTSPKPGDHSTSPKPGDHSTSPKPGDHSTSPKPGDQSTSPKPGDHSTSPKPGDHSTTPNLGDQSTSPKPGDQFTTSNPDGLTETDVPSLTSSTPAYTTSPRPETTSALPSTCDPCDCTSTQHFTTTGTHALCNEMTEVVIELVWDEVHNDSITLHIDQTNGVSQRIVQMDADNFKTFFFYESFRENNMVAINDRVMIKGNAGTFRSARSAPTFFQNVPILKLLQTLARNDMLKNQTVIRALKNVEPAWIWERYESFMFCPSDECAQVGIDVNGTVRTFVVDSNEIFEEFWKRMEFFDGPLTQDIFDFKALSVFNNETIMLPESKVTAGNFKRGPIHVVENLFKKLPVTEITDCTESHKLTCWNVTLNTTYQQSLAFILKEHETVASFGRKLQALIRDGIYNKDLFFETKYKDYSQVLIGDQVQLSGLKLDEMTVITRKEAQNRWRFVACQDNCADVGLWKPVNVNGHLLVGSGSYTITMAVVVNETTVAFETRLWEIVERFTDVKRLSDGPIMTWIVAQKYPNQTLSKTYGPNVDIHQLGQLLIRDNKPTK